MSSQPIELVTETAIVPQVHLGSIAVRNPKDMVSKATEMADALAEIITRQNLYKNINGKKYVMVEGWTTLGAMMGIVPVEEYCQPLPEGAGFEAKVKLVRASDGGMVGAASAECTRTESNWSKRDSYAVRSMSITRATGKAYRLSFSWIMKLAGFEATPAEEMEFDSAPLTMNGSKAQAQAVAQQKKADHAKGKPLQQAPDEHVETALTLTATGGGWLRIEGMEGLAILRSALTEEERAALEIHIINGGHQMKTGRYTLLEAACKKHDVKINWAGLPPAIIPDAEEPDQGIREPGEDDLFDPEIASTKRIANAGKKPYLRVVWEGKTYSCFDSGIWDAIERAKTAMFETEQHGKYFNIKSVIRLDGMEV